MTQESPVLENSGSSPAKLGGFKFDLRKHGGLLALVILLVFNALVTPNFLQPQTLFVNISQVATIAIVAIGMTMVIATGGIDLSVGAVMALAGALAPLIFLSPFGVEYPVLGLVAAFTLPLFAAAFCGLFNGVLVSVLNVQPIIATLILFISGRGIAQVLTNGNLQTFSNDAFSYLGTGKILGLPFQGWLTLLLALIAFWFVRRTL
ncbi:MAG: ABC transporter permease, partial [Pseudomonadota bacterium]